MVKILASVSPGEIRVAAWDGGRLIDYALSRPGAPDGVGDLHRGRILSVAPALAGSFARIDGAEGFLPDSENPERAGEGRLLGLRVTRAAQGGKGPRLSARLDPADAATGEAAIAASGPVALLRRGPCAVRRLAAIHHGAPIIVDDAALVAELRPALGERLRHAPSWDAEVAQAVSALADRDVVLAGGARLSVHPTPAVTAIDVDLGAATGDRPGKTAGQLAANRALLPELARQIRLRNVSGAIVVDLAGLSPTRRAGLGPAFAATLGADPERPRFLGFSALGLAEILRPRRHPPLHELLAGPHAAGLEALRLAAREIAAAPFRILRLRAASAVVTALRADPIALPALAALAGRPLMLVEDRDMASSSWRLEDIADG